MIKIKKGMMKNKQGMVGIILMLIANPLILLGLGIFVFVFMFTAYFMLGKILGAGLILLSVYMFFRVDWKFALLILLIGLLIFANPFNFEFLQMVRP